MGSRSAKSRPVSSRDGTAASVFIPADNQIRVALLRHCVQAGLLVTAYSEDRARVEEIYFALSQTPAQAPAGAKP